MIRFFGVAAASLLMLSTPPAVAQTGGGVLSKPIGTVLVDGAATAGGPVAAGSIVMTGAASSATIVYPDGCVVNVAAKSSVTVGSLSPCALAANGGTVPQGYTATIIVGAVVIGGAVAVIVNLNNSNSTSP